MHKLDHIVFGARSLEEGTNFIEKKLDIKLSEVGYHDFMGTHNRVVKVDKDIYLEVIAIDPSSKSPNENRWFNLDNPILQKKLEYSPQMIGYVIETKDKEILKHFCTPIEASRGNYKWNFAMPSLESNFFNKELIENGIIPSLINWKSNKPVYEMKNNQLSLNKIEIEILKRPIGKQDQYGCAIGGLKLIEFNSDDSVQTTPIHLNHKQSLLFHNHFQNHK